MNEKYKIQIATLSTNHPDFQMERYDHLIKSRIYGGSKEESIRMLNL